MTSEEYKKLEKLYSESMNIERSSETAKRLIFEFMQDYVIPNRKAALEKAAEDCKKSGFFNMEDTKVSFWKRSEVAEIFSCHHSVSLRQAEFLKMKDDEKEELVIEACRDAHLIPYNWDKQNGESTVYFSVKFEFEE